MEAITSNELMNVNGGMNRRGHGSGGNDTRLGRAIINRKRRTRRALRRHRRAAVRGVKWAYNVLSGGRAFGMW